MVVNNNRCQWKSDKGIRCTHEIDTSYSVTFDNDTVKNTFFCNKHMKRLQVRIKNLEFH